MNPIYLDNNATTRPDPLVVKDVLNCLQNNWANPSSPHSLGKKAKKAIENARSQVANLLNCSSSEIIFTSGGTESDNTAIFSPFIDLEMKGEKGHLIISAVEHPAIFEAAMYLQKKGHKLSIIKVDKSGILDLNQLYDEITEHTTLVSIMFANNETGVITPLKEAIDIVKEKGVLFHCDAVQAIGKIPINLGKLDIDMLSVSGHKFHALKGIGALFIKNGIKLNPLIMGGGQEQNRRSGTENVPGIIAIGIASKIANENLSKDYQYILNLKNELEIAIKNLGIELIINGKNSNRLPNTISVSFKNKEAQKIVSMLGKEGIMAGAGAACHGDLAEISHVLRAMGVKNDYAKGTIRFSLSRFNTKKEIEKVKDIILKIKDI